MATAAQKRAAKGAVQRAVGSGQLCRPDSCENCGIKAGSNSPNSSGPVQIHLHHHSYDEADWLDVIPLCVSCHRRLHRGLIREPRTGRLYTPRGQRPRLPKPPVRLPEFGRRISEALAASDIEHVADLHRELERRGFILARTTIDTWFKGANSPRSRDLMQELFDIFGIYGLVEQRDWLLASFSAEHRSQCATQKQAA